MFSASDECDFSYLLRLPGMFTTIAKEYDHELTPQHVCISAN